MSIQTLPDGTIELKWMCPSPYCDTEYVERIDPAIGPGRELHCPKCGLWSDYPKEARDFFKSWVAPD